ncbi:MAG: hypothetical protein AAB320_00925 [Elusimicrobiota bacterium]|mgnify:CR=1 FL=1
MKNMLLVMMLVAAPAAGQEFAAEMPFVADILAKTQALKTPPAASGRSNMMLASSGDRRADILAEIETLKVKYQKHEKDTTRSGIYALEISRLYMVLATTYPLGTAATSSPAQGASLVSFSDRRVEILAEIESLKEKYQKYRNDPTRSGIYAIELSRLYMALANHADRRI